MEAFYIVLMLGRGTWNRTTVLGFGDLRTNRCTIPLYLTLGYYSKSYPVALFFVFFFVLLDANSTLELAFACFVGGALHWW